MKSTSTNLFITLGLCSLLLPGLSVIGKLGLVATFVLIGYLKK